MSSAAGKRSRLKTFLKWTAGVLLVLAVAAFMAFLYYIPPFFTVPPETFSGPMATAAPAVTGIDDPAERAIAEHGRYIVMQHGCIGCHATNGSQGPDLTKYLAGGGLKFETAHGTFISRNLTPDKDTGLAKRTDDEVKRVLRSGVFPDGRVVPHTVMPWAGLSTWTEEDRHAVVVYLRHLPAIRHQIPDADLTPARLEAGAVEQGRAGKDYGVTAAVVVK